MSFKSFIRVALVSAAVLSLGGCETMNQSMSDTGDWFSRNNPFKSSGEAEKPAEPVKTANACVPVTTVDELKTLSQFMDEQAPRAENNISSAVITNVSANCSYNDKNTIVDLDITFDGALGPKAHTWKAEKPSFAYPYFVAITQPDGRIATKEVFGVTLSYEKGQNTMTQHEHMRQVIPQSAQPQQIVVGFQLTEAQLAYNRSLEGKGNAVMPASGAEPEKAPAKKAVKKAKAKAKPKHKKVKPAPAKTTEPATESSTSAPAPEAQAPAPAPQAAPVPEVESAPPAMQPAPQAETAPQAAPAVAPAPVVAAPAPAEPQPAPAQPAEPQNPAEAPAPAPQPTTPANGQ
jgi:hypothetical protein